MQAIKDVVQGIVTGALEAIAFVLNLVLLGIVLLGGLVHILGALVMIYPLVALLLATGAWMVLR